MKSSKLFTLDTEVIEQLQECPNASKLVNDLLKDHFRVYGDADEIKLREEGAKLIEQQKAIDIRSKVVIRLLNEKKTKRKQIKETYSNIPKEIIEDFEIYPKMDKHALMDRYDDYYKDKYQELNRTDLLNAFKEFKGK